MQISSQTPIKTIEKGISISRLSNKTIKQQATQQLQMEELQKKIQAKSKKCQKNEIEIKELKQQINKLSKIISKKQSQIIHLNQKIKSFTSTISKLQNQFVNHRQMKQITNSNIKQLTKQKNQHKTNVAEQQLRKLLAKQNYQLTTQKAQLQQMLSQYDLTLLQTRTLLKTEQQNSSQLKKMNDELKLQIEQAQFELRQAHKRVEVDRLYQYENRIQARANKQNDENGWRNNELVSKELVCLLKQRISNLEQQLNKSQTRCKQLQTILVAK